MVGGRGVGFRGAFPGGCDIVRKMFDTGELQSCIAENGIATNGRYTAT